MKRVLFGSVIVVLILFLVGAGIWARQRPEVRGFTEDTLDFEAMEHRTLAEVDVAALLREDAMQAGKPGVPYRIAYAMPVRYSFRDTGTTESSPDGGLLWRLRVSSPGALFLSFIFSDFYLPAGAELRFVSVDRDFRIGPYTSRNNNPERAFGSPIVAGDSAVIELFLPEGHHDDVSLQLESVSHGYRDFRNVSKVPPRPGRDADDRRPNYQFGRQGDPEVPKPMQQNTACEVDVNCPEGAQWQDDKRAVAEIFDGTFVCTGSMINNLREDCRNLFLTANHCVKGKGKASRLVFFWNYENSGCNTGDAPLDQTSTGSFFRAGYNQSDFTLLELFEDPDPAYFVYHAGWNRSNTPPSSGVTIHHPNDLPKKISFEFDPIEDGGNHSGGWGDDHWRVVGWDIGTTEPGSSGSGLWNSDHQIVGQLHGGVGDCDGGWDEYGKLSVSWVNGLSPFLDPDSAGAMFANGKDCVGSPPPPPPCELGQVGDPCTADSECCSGKCKGKPGNKTCK